MLNPDSSSWAATQLNRLKTDLLISEDGNEESTNFFARFPFDRWQSELSKLRSTSPEKAAARELEIIQQVRLEMSKIPYEIGRGTPEQMISGGSKNCEGASILGSMILEELGILHRFLCAQSPTKSPGHVLILAIDAMGTTHWIEMTNTSPTQEVTADSFVDNSGNKLPAGFPDMLQSREAVLDLKLTDPKFKGEVGNKVLGLVSNLSISVELLSPQAGREIIVLSRQASILFDEEKYDEAIQLYEHVIQLGSTSDKTLRNYGLCLRGAGKYSEAVEIYKRLCQEQPTTLRNWAALAQTYRESGDMALAEEAQHTGIKEKPGAYYLYQELKEHLVAVGRQQEALQQLKSFIERNPTSCFEAYTDLIQIHLHLGNFDDALQTIAVVEANGLAQFRNDRNSLAELKAQAISRMAV